MHYLSSVYSRVTWCSLHARRHKNLKNKSRGTTTILISHYRHFYGSIKKERHSNSISKSVRRLAPKSGTEKAAYTHPSARTCFAFSCLCCWWSAACGDGRDGCAKAVLLGGLAPRAVAVPSVWHWRGVPVFPGTPARALAG